MPKNTLSELQPDSASNTKIPDNIGLCSQGFQGPCLHGNKHLGCDQQKAAVAIGCDIEVSIAFQEKPNKKQQKF